MLLSASSISHPSLKKHRYANLLISLISLAWLVRTCHGSCNKIDHEALSSFRQGLSLASPPLNWSVTAGGDCCNNWEGIACDGSGRVSSLWLPSRGLVGTISPSLSNLTSLSRINLSHNWLSGPLPDKFFAPLTKLQLVDLSRNRLSGEISQTDRLSITVQSFNLSSNHFHGTIQESLFQTAGSLEAFDVSNNSFSGTIPSSMCSFSPFLRRVDFTNNDVTSSIPRGFGLCRNLQSLRAGFCNLSGEIPGDVYGLLGLEELSLPGNKLSGQFDARIINLTNLRSLELYGNELTGTIPQDIGKLYKLQVLQLHINQLSGPIPASLASCSGLTTLNLRANLLEGELSTYDFSNLGQLRTVDLGNNFFRGDLPRTLFSIKTLTAVRLAANNLTGEIIPEMGLLQSLSFLSISNNSLSNMETALRILSSCKNLTALILSKNFYDEPFPTDQDLEGVGTFQNLQVLALGGCRFTGQIPTWMAKLITIEVLDLSFNKFTGSVPGWFGPLPDLFYLDLSYNLLSGNFPMELLGLPRLSLQQNTDEVLRSYLELPVFVQPYNASNLQYNQLSNLPTALYLGGNTLTGNIPAEIGRLKYIISLDLSNNSFAGEIPDTISNLSQLEKLDLSRNQLTGEIPLSLQNLNFLSSLNVAYNDLQGPIPTGGQFDTFPSSSFEGNSKLCGRLLQRTCGDPHVHAESYEPQAKMSKTKTIVLVFAVCSGIFVLSLLLIFFVSKRRARGSGDPEKDNNMETMSFNSSGVFPEVEKDSSLVVLFPNNKNKAISDLTIIDILKATDNFNQSNIIGCGGFGLVYKATLPDGTHLAIKKLSGEMGLMEREFKAEVEALSTAQHKNLVVLQGYCVHDGFRLLIYSYMENGSLDYWLHEKPDGPTQLSWPIRLKIARGASCGVAYMHQVCEPHIVHRDLKSSNILLDSDFEAYVADFGLARLILPYHTHVTTELVGTLGYIPPEYSQSWIATLRGDVYSFGVLMLELLTGKRPMEMFRSKSSRELVKWVQLMRNEGRTEEIFDPSLRNRGFEEEMLRVLDVACMCVNQSPPKRPSIREVVDWLKELGSNSDQQSATHKESDMRTEEQ